MVVKGFLSLFLKHKKNSHKLEIIYSLLNTLINTPNLNILIHILFHINHNQSYEQYVAEKKSLGNADVE